MKRATGKVTKKQTLVLVGSQEEKMVDSGTESNEKQNQPNTGVYPGTVLLKANPGLSLRVLAGESNRLVMVLSRKGNQKQTLVLVGS